MGGGVGVKGQQRGRDELHHTESTSEVLFFFFFTNFSLYQRESFLYWWIFVKIRY